MPLRDKEAHRAYCRAYYYAHDGKNRKRRQKRTREQILERVRLYSVEYRRKNKDKIRAYKARPEVRAKQKVHAKKWRDAHKDYMREYYALHPERFREYLLKFRTRRALREMIDCVFYAAIRAKNRAGHAKRRMRKGKVYLARPSKRVPDYCCRGGVLDVRSQWLAANLTAEQRAYARELAIERNQRKEA